MKKYIHDSVSRGTDVHYLIRSSETGEIERIVTKFLKYEKNCRLSQKTREKHCLYIEWYLNYLAIHNLTYNMVLELSYADQQEHFINYLYWVKSGRHTDKGKGPGNDMANKYLGLVFKFYEFLTLEYDNDSELKVLDERTYTYSSSVGVKTRRTIKSFNGYLPNESKKGSSISEADIKTLIENCKNTRDKLLLLLLMETGFRIGELLGVHYDKDIDFENHKIFVRYRTGNENKATAKYAENRGALISEQTFAVLEIYLSEYAHLLKDTSFLFISLSGNTKGKPLSLKAVYGIFERLEERCGIKSHAHSLRHYFANERRKAGWDTAQISKALGHRNIATTENYMNVEEEELVVAADEYFKSTSSLININDFL